jgi:hypothetical protein
MLEVMTDNADSNLALLNVDDLENAIGGAVQAKFTIGNDTWTITASSACYIVDHIHVG